MSETYNHQRLPRPHILHLIVVIPAPEARTHTPGAVADFLSKTLSFCWWYLGLSLRLRLWLGLAGHAEEQVIRFLV